MAISGIDPQALLQISTKDIQNRKPLSYVRPADDTTNKKLPQREPVSPIQDQVTLSPRAQALSTSQSQTPNNSTFQQSPSPFDK